MQRFAGLVVLGLLLVALIAWTVWAQEPDPEAEPDPPVAASEDENTGLGSAAGSSVASSPAVEVEVPADAWRRSAAVPAGVPVESLSPPDGAQAAIDDEILQPYANHRVAGSALRPRQSSADFSVYWTGGCIFASSSGAVVWNTPLHLPQGSNIQYLRMYYRDASSSNSMAWFTVYDLFGDIVDEWGVSSDGDTGEGFRDTELISHTIDYQTYSYVLNWRPNDASQDMQLCGFRIFYERPLFSAVALPSVTKDYP
jgi:hypothetical protein